MHVGKVERSETSACCSCHKFSEYVPVRVTLGLMSFLGFMVAQMLRSNLYIAVVAMLDADNPYAQPVDWSEGSQGYVLSAFYWSYWMTELPGGVLAQRFGPRLVLTVATCAAGLMTLVMPMACYAGPAYAAALRAAQGLALGVTWPAMHCLSGRWVPTTERSKFMSTYHGAAIGNALIFPLSGVLIAHSGWPWVFYVSGLLAITWSVLWWCLVRDAPELHPCMAERERRYLARNLQSLTRSRHTTTPWTKILTSGPCWAVMFASQGLMWGTITLSMQLPSYFEQVHQLNIEMNGILSGLPEIFKCIFGFVFSVLIDYSLKRKLLTITVARKLAVATCEMIPAFLLAILTVCGSESTTAAAAILILSFTVGGASSAGSLANIVDLSPNYAGAILGLIKTLSLIPGVLSPIIAGAFTASKTHEDAGKGWSLVFLLTSFVYCVCCMIFLVFGSGNVQSWDYVQTSDTQQTDSENVDLQTEMKLAKTAADGMLQENQPKSEWRNNIAHESDEENIIFPSSEDNTRTH